MSIFRRIVQDLVVWYAWALQQVVALLVRARGDLSPQMTRQCRSRPPHTRIVHIPHLFGATPQLASSAATSIALLRLMCFFGSSRGIRDGYNNQPKPNIVATCYADSMTFARWIWITGLLALLPVIGIVPRGSLLHTLCVLPFGLTLLLAVPAVMLIAAWIIVRSVLR